MEIFAFLVVFSIAILLIAWGFGFFKSPAPKQKSHSKIRPQTQLLPKSLEPQKRDTATLAKPTLPPSPLQNKIIPTSTRTIVPRQSLAFQKSRTRSTNKHQLNIQHGDRVLQRLRSEATEVELPMVLATLRHMNPYAFEELLLTCCKDQGWQIQRNFCYSNDGGVDGQVAIKEKLYLIQTKGYGS